MVGRSQGNPAAFRLLSMDIPISSARISGNSCGAVAASHSMCKRVTAGDIPSAASFFNILDGNIDAGFNPDTANIHAQLGGNRFGPGGSSLGSHRDD